MVVPEMVVPVDRSLSLGRVAKPCSFTSALVVLLLFPLPLLLQPLLLLLLRVQGRARRQLLAQLSLLLLGRHATDEIVQAHFVDRDEADFIKKSSPV